MPRFYFPLHTALSDLFHEFKFYFYLTHDEYKQKSPGVEQVDTWNYLKLKRMCSDPLIIFYIIVPKFSGLTQKFIFTYHNWENLLGISGKFFLEVGHTLYSHTQMAAGAGVLCIFIWVGCLWSFFIHLSDTLSEMAGNPRGYNEIYLVCSFKHKRKKSSINSIFLMLP